jgi:lysophospholipase L1-like esterase
MRRFVAPVLAALTGLPAVGLAALGDGGVASAQAGRIVRVVTMGDSYSSGNGIHKDADDYDDHGPASHSFDPATRLGHSACYRESDTTPGPRLAADLDIDSVFVACAGAVVEEIPNQVELADIPGEGYGTLVTITIGGNDLRTERGEDWPDVILRCIFDAGCHESDGNQPTNLDDLEDDLTETYRAVGERYPGITVRVLGYPRLMQRDFWGCSGMTGVSRSEADWIDDQVDRLNERIVAAADSARADTGADIRFVDVTDEFDNRGSCRMLQRDRYVNDSILGKTLKRELQPDGDVVDMYADGLFHVSSSSVHPSQKGYDAYGRALRASLPGWITDDFE